MDYKQRAEMLLSGNSFDDVKEEVLNVCKFDFVAEFSIQTDCGRCVIRFSNKHNCLSIIDNNEINHAFIEAVKHDNRVKVINCEDGIMDIRNVDVVFVNIADFDEKEAISDYIDPLYHEIKLYIMLEEKKLNFIEYIDFKKVDNFYISNNTNE